jgi:nucleotide-binding universal stress UspA family protein
MRRVTQIVPGQRVGERGPDPVVALGSETPDWLEEWCQDTGRGLEVRPVPESEGGAPPFASGLAREVTGLIGHTVWISHNTRDSRPSSVAAAIRELPGDAHVLAEAAAVSAYLGATLIILHAVPISFAERNVGLDAAVSRGRSLLESAAASATAHLPDGCVTISRLVRAHPHELVGETLDADLLVIGGPRGRRDAASGLVRDTALHHAPCPLLLAPRTDDLA